ncbi:MAG TPA: acylphosphatase, partial [Candidatus Binatia bacterium]|nr:acylphosphatase [Candidatus Binatia bacterium]
GWVRNRRNGTVEALVSGAAESVDELVAACWRGPPGARVADIQIETPESAETPAGFAIRPTA